MRTKTLLGLAVLAVGLSSALADNVYSLNVVGYVNVTVPHQQFSGIANPLDGTMGGTVAGGNNINQMLVSGIPGGSTIQVWDSGLGDWGPVSTFSARSGTWDNDFVFAPGLGGFFFNNDSDNDTVLTFVGQVQQGAAIPVATMGFQQFSFVGSPVPIGGSIVNSTTGVGLAPNGGDTVQIWDSGLGDWGPVSTFSGRSSTWDNDTQIAPGQAFFYFNNSGDTPNVWTCNFTVQ